MKEFRFSEVIPPGSRRRGSVGHEDGDGGQGEGDVNSVNNLVSVSLSMWQLAELILNPYFPYLLLKLLYVVQYCICFFPKKSSSLSAAVTNPLL